MLYTVRVPCSMLGTVPGRWVVYPGVYRWVCTGWGIPEYLPGVYTGYPSLVYMAS